MKQILSLLLVLLLITPSFPQGTTQGTNTIGGGSGAQVFNVTSYGAKADLQQNSSGASTTSGQPTVTCAGCNFTQADVGKKMWVNGGGVSNISGTVLSVTTGVATLNHNATNTASGAYTVYWGTDNSTPFQNAVNAANAAGGGTVWVPSGNYAVGSRAFDLNNTNGVHVVGPSSSSTFIFPSQDLSTWTTSDGSVFRAAALGWSLEGIAFQGYCCMPTQPYVVVQGGHAGTPPFGDNWQPMPFMRDVAINNFTTNSGWIGLKVNGSNITFYNVWVQNNDNNCFDNGGGGVTFFESYCGNSPTGSNGYNLQISGVTGSQTTGGFHWIGGTLDECGSSVTTVGCTQVINSKDVYFAATTIWTGNAGAPALSVDGTSVVQVSETVVGPYLTATNATGALVASGGILKLSQSKIIGKGTGVSVSNSGTVYDVGGNTWQHCVTSGVESCSPATIAQSYSGTEPISSLTHSTYNFFAPSNTAQTWMKQTIDQPIQITRIQVTPGNGASVSCTVAPVIQVTDGTTALTVNVANATATDDSGAITSANTYASGATLQFNVSAAGTCTTAPTNYNVSVLWSSIAPSN